MRIAMIFRKLNIIGGSQRHALNIALKLQETGHDVTLYAIHPGEGGFTEAIKKFRVVTLARYHAPVYDMANPLRQIKSFFTNIRNENADARALALLIDPATEILNPHHDPITYKVAYYFKQCVRNIPSVWTMNDLTTRQFLYTREQEVNPGWKPSRIKELFNRIADYYEKYTFIAAQDAISVLDDRDQKWAEEKFGREAVVVRSGIEVANFPYRARTSGLQKNNVKLLASGIFFAHRRFEDIIEAMALMRDKQGIDATLSIVGKYEEKDPYYVKIRDLVRARGLESFIRFLGQVSEDDLLAYRRSHDIFLFPSHLQSWGIAVFEAMACGMPVIVSKTAGASEILTDNESALLVDPKDPRAIADAITRMVEHPDVYMRLSVNGRKFVEENMSWEKSAQHMLALFERVSRSFRSSASVKTILTLASTSIFIRNFIRTDARNLLAQNRVRMVVLAPKEKLAYYRAEYGDNFLQFEELPPLKKMLRERIFQFLENASIHTQTTTMLQQTKFRRFKSSGYWPARFVVFVCARMCWYFGQFAWWRNCIRRAYACLPNHALDAVIEEYKPDLIFCPSMFYTEDYVLLKAAKRYCIPAVGMVLSWDNFYSKTFLRVYPDRLIVHTDAIRDLAVRYGDYPAARIAVTGVPQYDRHFRREDLKSRDDFIRELGGDPSKKLIVYAFSGKAALHIDFDVLDMIAAAMKNGEIKDAINVLVRPYPKFDMREARAQDFRSKYGFLVHPSVAHVGPKGEYDWEFDEPSIDLLENTLAHADLVISMYSTYFIEAAIFDTPLIAVGFDGYKENLDYWNSATRFFDWNHLQDIKKCGGIRIVQSREELVAAINGYLENPKQEQEGRKKITDEQCQFTDGNSAERVASVLLRELRN